MCNMARNGCGSGAAPSLGFHPSPIGPLGVVTTGLCSGLGGILFLFVLFATTYFGVRPRLHDFAFASLTAESEVRQVAHVDVLVGLWIWYWEVMTVPKCTSRWFHFCLL